MTYRMEAACGSHIGRIRSNNEDNFFFAGRCLEMNNAGLRRAELIKGALETRLCFGVFDGMGGEEHGEVASFAAVQELKNK